MRNKEYDDFHGFKFDFGKVTQKKIVIRKMHDMNSI